MDEKEMNRRKFIKDMAVAGVGAAVLAELTGKNAHAADAGLNVLVLYFSGTGNTALAASAVAEGAKQVPGANVSIRKIPGAVTIKGQQVPDVTDDDLKAADCILMGSPVRFANAVGELIRLMQASTVNLYGKFGGVFATGGHVYGGMDIVMNQLLVLMIHKAMVVGGTREQKMGYGGVGVGAATFPPSPGVDEHAAQTFRELGRDVATSARQWKMGAGPA